MKKFSFIIAICLLIIGTIIISIVLFGNTISNQQHNQDKQNFISQNSVNIQQENYTNTDLYLAFKQYNGNLYITGQKDLKDPFSYEDFPFNLEKFGYNNNIIGYIEIEKINITLPIFIGASTENLAQGAALMGNTSLPINENNENSVIAAHRGYWYEEMFKNIDSLQPGDIIKITNPWTTIEYKVYETEILEENDINAITIQENRNIITLLSCHPYMEWGQRIAVYCEKI